ncbi:MAG TPA: hypothetical protein VGK02_11915 [Candidatus Aquicultor sp.]|jgi:hypothetical protein
MDWLVDRLSSAKKGESKEVKETIDISETGLFEPRKLRFNKRSNGNKKATSNRWLSK